MYRPALITGAICAALAVVLGAFGAHALKSVLAPDQLLVFETGVRYQMYHSFALLLAGIVYPSFHPRRVGLAATFFLVGILLFSGSLYAMSLLSAGHISLGAVGILTPIGGLFFIIGWCLLVAAFVKGK